MKMIVACTWFWIVLVLMVFASCAALDAAETTNAATTKLPTAGITGPAADWLTFGLDQVPLLQHQPFGGIPLWQFFASLIYIFLAFMTAWVLDRLVHGRLRKWAEATETKVDDLLLDLLRGPVKVITFVILLHVGMEVYRWPPALADFFSKALKIIVAGSLTYVLLKLVDLAVGVWHQRATVPENEVLGRSLLPLIRKTLKVFVVIVAVLVTSQNLGLNVTGLIASLSIGGLALGLAAQDTLGNIFGAVAVLTDRPFHVGDRIQLDNVDGCVEVIGFRSTRVRNLDGHLVTIPNKTMGNATIVNVSKRPTIKTVMNIGITYDAPAEKIEQALAILETIFRGHPMTADVWLSFDRFADSSLNLLVIHWWNSTDYKAYLAGMKEMNLAIKRRFDAAGIEFAFPSRTVYLKQESDEKPALPAPDAATARL
jgi:MscS family membrane protein